MLWHKSLKSIHYRTLLIFQNKKQQIWGSKHGGDTSPPRDLRPRFDKLSIFANNNLFSSQQYGFKKNASTELAALELIYKLLTQLKYFEMPVNFYMDLSKAFDSLSHDILLNKLTYYGVKNSTTDLLRSYLPNRKQYVQIDAISSAIVSINTGMP